MNHRTTAFALCAALLGAAGMARADFVVTKVGAPTFDLVDLHQFAAPIGTSADNYAEFAATQQLLLPEPFYKFDPSVGGVTPDQPRPTDTFTTDFANGLAANGLADKDVFPVSDYSNGQAVFFVFMAVPGPGAPSGSSTDYPNGPIIANSQFPLAFSAQTFKDGAFADVTGMFSLDVIHPSLDGESHIPFFFTDNSDFFNDPGMPIPGSYEYRVQFRDAQGNGYDIDARFTVVPEPASLASLALGLPLIGLSWQGWKRGRSQYQQL